LPQEHNIGSEVIYYYCHLNGFEDKIEPGSKIKQGQEIGITGSTGNAANINDIRQHLHLILYKGGIGANYKVHPNEYLNTKFDNNGNTIK